MEKLIVLILGGVAIIASILNIIATYRWYKRVSKHLGDIIRFMEEREREENLKDRHSYHRTVKIPTIEEPGGVQFARMSLLKHLLELRRSIDSRELRRPLPDMSPGGISKGYRYADGDTTHELRISQDKLDSLMQRATLEGVRRMDYR